MELFSVLNNVNDKNSFLYFLSMLRDDYINNKKTWENQSIDSYIDSIIAWINDYEGDDINTDNPNWKSISAMFYMGKLYE